MYSVDPYQPPNTSLGSEPKPRRPQIGGYSLLLVLFALLLAGFHHDFSSSLEAGSAMRVAYAWLTLLLVFSGFVTGIVAVVKNPRSARVMIPACAALPLSGTLLLVAGQGFMAGRARALAQREENAKNEQVMRDMMAPAPAKNGEAPQPLTPDEKIARMEEATKKMTGTQADVARVMKPIIAEIQECLKAEEQASRELKDLVPFVPAKFQTPGSIQNARTLFQRGNATVQRWIQVQRAADGKVTDGLKKAGFADADIQRFLVNWQRSREKPVALGIQAREGAMRSNTAMLGILDLLEQERGEWRGGPGGHAVFNRHTAQVKYDELVTEHSRANAETARVAEEYEMLKAGRR